MWLAAPERLSARCNVVFDTNEEEVWPLLVLAPSASCMSFATCLWWSCAWVWVWVRVWEQVWVWVWVSGYKASPQIAPVTSSPAPEFATPALPLHSPTHPVSLSCHSHEAHGRQCTGLCCVFLLCTSE